MSVLSQTLLWIDKIHLETVGIGEFVEQAVVRSRFVHPNWCIVDCVRCRNMFNVKPLPEKTASYRSRCRKNLLSATFAETTSRWSPLLTPLVGVHCCWCPLLRSNLLVVPPMFSPWFSILKQPALWFNPPSAVFTIFFPWDE